MSSVPGLYLSYCSNGTYAVLFPVAWPDCEVLTKSTLSVSPASARVEDIQRTGVLVSFCTADCLAGLHVASCVFFQPGDVDVSPAHHVAGGKGALGVGAVAVTFSLGALP